MLYVGITVAILAFFAADYAIAMEFYKAAVMKGWARKKYFWLPFLTGLAGWLLVASLPDRGAEAGTEIVSKNLPEL